MTTMVSKCVRRTGLLACGLSLLLGLWASRAAAELPGPLVRVRVVGVNSVQPEQVVGWAGLVQGQTLTREGVARAVRKLTQLGRFADIFAYELPVEGGVELTLNVVEYPRLSEVRLEGFEKLKREELAEEIRFLRVGDFLAPASVTRLKRQILDKYKDEGYYNAEIFSDSTSFAPGPPQPLVLRITEGKKVKVKEVRFEGNQVLTRDDLKDVMETKPGGFFGGGTFKPKELEQDLVKIVDLYRDRGHLDAEVVSHDIEFVEERTRVIVAITVSEGEVYTLGKVTWEGNTVFGDERIARELRIREGETYSQSKFDETVQGFHNLYYEAGYIYFGVEPDRKVGDRVVDIALQFFEGSPAHINQIQITGNTKTHEQVIRREVSDYIVPGDLFVNSRLRDSQRDIFQLGYFNDVQVDVKPVEGGEDIDLILNVEEKQTGQFSMGLGFSQQSQATGFLQVGESNLFGRGQQLQFSWQFGSRRNFLDISFTEPWFMGTPTLVGVDVFNRFSNTFRDFYDTRVRGFAFRIGRPIPGTRYSRFTLRYGLSQTTLSNFDQDYIDFLDDLERDLSGDIPFQRLDEEDWPQTKSGFTLTLSRNSTNNPFFPTAGSNNRLRYEIVGGLLGGDLDYQKILLNYDWYRPLPGRLAFHVGAFTGYLAGLGRSNNVPDYEKFRLGGNRFFGLRGYRDLDVVPRDNPEFIGGRFFTTLTTEVLYPVTRAVHLLAFVDQGDVWNSFDSADLTQLRTGAGFGIRLEVPLLGRVGLDYGYGFDKDNPGWEPHFNFGAFF